MPHRLVVSDKTGDDIEHKMRTSETADRTTLDALLKAE
jgi:hypothetical protein